jgi:hypothetical protein
LRLINPSGYGHDFSIKYAKNQTLGQAGNEAKFHASQPQKLNLKELIWMEQVSFPAQKTVKEQVQTLRNTIYSYVGVKHETPIVQIVWGSLIFYGRAEGMKFDYTLFKPNGEPLRAKITLNFVEYISPGKWEKEGCKFTRPDSSDHGQSWRHAATVMRQDLPRQWLLHGSRSHQRS